MQEAGARVADVPGFELARGRRCCSARCGRGRTWALIAGGGRLSSRAAVPDDRRCSPLRGCVMTEEELQARLEDTPERDRYELFVEESQDQDVRRALLAAGRRGMVDCGVADGGRHLVACGSGRRGLGHPSQRDAPSRRRNQPTSSPCRASSGATATSSMPRPGCSATPSSRRCCTRRRVWRARLMQRSGRFFQAPSTTPTMSRMICVRSKSLGV